MEMTEFLTWEVLTNFTMFVSIVFYLVEFTKELPLIKRVPTKYWSAIIAFMLIIALKVHEGVFDYWNMILYGINAMLISFLGGGIADFNKNKKT